MDDEEQPAQLAAMPNTPDRDRLEYDLTIRQQPKQARMCGVGGKADRRPIDPPPIIQLRVFEKGSSRSSSPDGSSQSHYSQFLQNPYYFMFASLASPDTDEELHLLKDGKTRCTTGSVVSSLYHLKDTEIDGERGPARDAGFFVFPDLSVRTEGSYRLKLTLFEVVDANVHYCKHIFTAPFYVYTAKKFPGMEESTNLSCALADQGIKIRIRKDIRIRKNRVMIQPLPDDQQNIPPTARAMGLPPPMDDSEGSGDELYPDTRNGPSERENKRMRFEGPENDNDNSAPAGPPANGPGHSQSNGSWGIDPSLSPGIHSHSSAPPPPPSSSQEHNGYDPRTYNAIPPPPPPPHSHPSHAHMQHPQHHTDYHHPPPLHHQHPGHVLPPHHHGAPPPPPQQMSPPNNGYGSYWGPPQAPLPPPQSYAGYHQPVYDHHQPHIPPPAPPLASHSQHQRGPGPGPPPPQHPQHYGHNTALQPMHYGAPPPYPYYDHNGSYSQPPLPPPPGVPVSSPPSPRSAMHHPQSSGRSAPKDSYNTQAQNPVQATGPAHPLGTYPPQDYNYGRPPPPPPPQDSRSTGPPSQQSRGYQQPYAPGPPPPQHQHQQPPHMGHYALHPSSHHPGYGYPPPPPDPYGWSYPPFQPQPQPQAQAQAQQPVPPPQVAPGQPLSPYTGRLTTQNNAHAQWSSNMPNTPPPVPVPAPNVQGQYGYNNRTPPGAHQSFGDAYGQSNGNAAAADHRAYGRASLEDGRRPSPPPVMPMQSRHPSYNNGAPTMNGNGNSSSQGYGPGPISMDRRPSGNSNSPPGNMNGGGNLNVGAGIGDRIQLAPLRASAGSPTPTSATSAYPPPPFQMNRAGPNGGTGAQYGSSMPMHLERTGSGGSVSGSGKKNLLSIGSIISDEKN